MSKLHVILDNHTIVFSRFTENVTVNEFFEVNKKKTKCEIFNRKGVKVSQGIVSLHHKDTDSRIVGRQYALRKAMSELNYSKDDKKKIWDDYINDKLRNLQVFNKEELEIAEAISA